MSLASTPTPRAGRRIRSCDLLVAEGFDVNVLVLNQAKIPIRSSDTTGRCLPDRLRSSRPYLEYLLDQAAEGVDFAHDESRRQFLGKMLTVAARIPEATAETSLRIGLPHRARVTEDVVRAEIREGAVQKRPS